MKGGEAVKRIDIKGVIIPNDYKWIYDWFEIESTCPNDVNKQLQQANGDDLEVIINSGGGSVFDASEIYTALKDYKGKVTVKIVGIAASAASVIAMAGDKIMMSPTAQMMIHNASTYAQGDYRDMDHTSEFLKNVNKTIANAYQLQSGKTYDELLSMMDNETWLTPQQALELNLIDEIMFENQTIQVAASTYSQMIPQKIIDKIRNELKANRVEGVTNLADGGSNSQNINNEEEDEIMTLDELKEKYPELYNQVKKEGYDEGVKAENKRIKAIEDLGIPGFEELFNKAKFETGATAEQLAVDIIKAQKEQGKNYLKNREKDAKELNDVKGSEAPENNNSEEKEIEETANFMAKVVNKMRGGNK